MRLTSNATVLALAVLTACDPGMPNAQGTLSLSTVIEAADFAYVHIVAFPNPVGRFDLQEFGSRVDATPHREVQRIVEEVAYVSFPGDYRLSSRIGTSRHRVWRVVAWLSNDARDRAPTTGEPYGTRSFEANSCGCFGSYCGATEGVGFTIDRVAP